MLHPSKFFEWCAIRTGIDVFEIFDDNLKKRLMNIHPKNFIKSKLFIKCLLDMRRIKVIIKNLKNI